MKEFNFEFNAKTLGKHYFIIEQYGNSGICTCGYHNEDITKIMEACPNCGTKAIIYLRITSFGDYYSTYQDTLQYLAFNNEEFQFKKIQYEICVSLKTVVINNKPAYKIAKDTLSMKQTKEIDLKFYYKINKRGVRTLASEYYENGEEIRLMADNCPTLFNTSLLSPEINEQLINISIEQYYSRNVWKIYSYYKYAPDLIRNGYTGFKGNATEMRKLNQLFKNKEINPYFDKMIEIYKAVFNNLDQIDYCRIKRIFSITDSFYEPEKYSSDFIKFITEINPETLSEINRNTADVNCVLRFFYELGFTSEETEKVLQLAIRQKASLYEICNSRTMDTVTVMKEFGVTVDKNIKDIRIFLAKLKIFRKVDTYSYNLMQNIPGNNIYKTERLNYQNKLKSIFSVFSKYTEDVFMSFFELVMDRRKENFDISLLYKENDVIEDCFVCTDSDLNVCRIYYKDLIISSKEEIEEFLSEKNEGLGYAV